MLAMRGSSAISGCGGRGGRRDGGRVLVEVGLPDELADLADDEDQEAGDEADGPLLERQATSCPGSG